MNKFVGEEAVSERQKRMAALIRQLAPDEGYTLTALNGVRLMRSNRPLSRTPVMYDPCIVVVCQGRKRGYFGDEMHIYDAQHFLVLSVPLPFSTETEANEEEPMLAISLAIDRALTAELLLALNESGTQVHEVPKSMASAPMTVTLADAVLRLLTVLQNPLEARVIGPGILREIHFRVLTGALGGAMRGALGNQGHYYRVSKALRRIHSEFAEALDVAALAAEAGMSVPSFHAHFKEVTNTSPLQYLKATRLHQARLLMIRSGVTAAAACARVGYESPSQFSREFRRMFGRSPAEEANRMKHSLQLVAMDV